MKSTHISAAICSAALLFCSSCSNEPTAPFVNTSSQTTAAPAVTAASQTSAVTTTSATEPVNLEQPVSAGDGDAFLFLTNGDFSLSYSGTGESSSKEPAMCYNAGIAAITGDGKYTVSVTNDTKALRLDVTGDPDGELNVKGCQFAAVVVKNGSVLFPYLCIEINEIRKDGKPIPMTAKNYTFSDKNVDMRANIYNQWVNAFPEDAHTANGSVTGEFNEYSAQIIDPETIGAWKTIEVDFTVLGCTGPVTTAPVTTTTTETTTGTGTNTSTSSDSASGSSETTSGTSGTGTSLSSSESASSTASETTVTTGTTVSTTAKK